MTITKNSTWTRLPGISSDLRMKQEVAVDSYWARTISRNLNYSICARTPVVLLTHFDDDGSQWGGGSDYTLGPRGWSLLWRPCDELEVMVVMKASEGDTGHIKVEVSQFKKMQYLAGTSTPQQQYAAKNVVLSSDATAFSDAAAKQSGTIEAPPLTAGRTIYVACYLKDCTAQSIIVYGRAYD